MSKWPTELGPKLGPFISTHFPEANESQALATYSDSDGWGLIWDGSLGAEPTHEQVRAWQPDPRPDVKKKFQSARGAADDLIFDLMSDVAFAMVAFGKCTPAEADDKGSDFVDAFQAEITAVLLSGRNARKLQKLLSAIQDSERNSPFGWLATPIPGGTILGLFEARLSTPT